jgi:hypothetical protein
VSTLFQCWFKLNTLHKTCANFVVASPALKARCALSSLLRCWLSAILYHFSAVVWFVFQAHIVLYLLTSWNRVLFDSPSWANRILWNPKVCYRVHKSPPVVPILNQINPFHPLQPIYLKRILIISSHLRLGLTSCHLPWYFPIKILHASFSPPYVSHVPPSLGQTYLLTRVNFEGLIM